MVQKPTRSTTPTTTPIKGQVTTGIINKTVYYLGNYEKEIRDNHIYHRIQIGDVAIVEQVDDNAESIHYTLRDHLGSLIATVSDTGTIKRLFYDPWGKRLDLPVLEAQPITLFDLASFLTPRGFTGHEHLDNVGLIHMNGRVYDPEIARFVSADPILSAPTYLQSYNRYSYVWNNPLRFTDPNGFEPASMRGTGLDGHGIHPNYDRNNNRWDHDKDHSKANKQYAQKQALELKREIQRIAQVKADRAEAKRIEAAKFAEIARIAQARKDAALAQQKEADERAAAQQGIGAVPGYDETGSNSWRASNDQTFTDAANSNNYNHGLSPGDPDYMTPQMLKAWAMVESGGNKSAFLSDPLQVNNPGDWDARKANLGLTQGGAMTPATSAYAGLEWMRYKGYVHDSSGAETYYRGHWQALRRYNGNSSTSYRQTGGMQMRDWYADRVFDLYLGM